MADPAANEAFQRALQHHQANRLAEAEALYRFILQHNPNHSFALGLLGILCGQTGRHEAAVDLLRRAISAILSPQGFSEHLGQCYAHLGQSLRAINQLDESVAAFHKAIEFDPRDPAIHINLGKALGEVGRLDDALQCYLTAVSLDPTHPDAHHNAAVGLKNCWRLPEAIEHLRRCLAIQPDAREAHSDLLVYLLHSPDQTQDAIFAEHQRWGQLHASAASTSIRQHSNSRDPRRRLRIGYLLPNRCGHAVGFFLEPILANHDRVRFEIFCYSSAARLDAATERLWTMPIVGRTVAGLSDEQVADLIRSDGIDILIDLIGHSADNRLPVLARKPAPVQATYLGYQHTTGIPAVDYRITDPIVDPAGLSEHYHTEQLLRLPRVFACYQPPRPAPEVSPLPALRQGHVTFGSSAVMIKHSTPMLRHWAAVMRNVPDSHLLLVADSLSAESVRRRVLGLFESEGIAANRLDLRPACPFDQYLQMHGEIDLMLDTFPFNCHTTTCHGLWMGVPIVTLAGQSYASRMGLSVLTNLGLEELAANSADEFVTIASNQAQDLPRLAELRAGMRHRMRQSPMMDAARFTKDLEALFRGMWQKWCEA